MAQVKHRSDLKSQKTPHILQVIYKAFIVDYIRVYL